MYWCWRIELWWFIFCVVFFKQKTAYEMRISDWSSDVCSSDLATQSDATASTIGDEKRSNPVLTQDEETYVRELLDGLGAWPAYYVHMGPANAAGPSRSEERRVGKERVSKCRSRWSPYH